MNQNEQKRNLCLQQFKEMTNIIDKLTTQYNNLENNISKYIEDSKKYSQELKNEINNYINKLETPDIVFNINNKNLFIDSISEKFKAFYSSNDIIYLDIFIKEIEKLNEEINNMFFDLKEFSPGNINSFIDNSDVYFNFPDNDENDDGFYQNINNQCNININEEEQNNKNNSIDIICSVCNTNKAIKLCQGCIQLFCDNCLEIILNNEIGKKEKKKHMHNIKLIKDILNEKEKEKISFINSFEYIIKIIISKCDYLLEHEKIELMNINNNKNYDNNNNSILKMKYINRLFNYPCIKNYNDASQIDFLNNINDILNNEFKQKDFPLKKFDILTINDLLFKKIAIIIKDEKTGYQKLEEIDNKFYSDDEISYSKKEKKEEIKLDQKEFGNSKNKFYYLINIVERIRNNSNKENIINVFIDEVSNQLGINDDNIYASIDNKRNFIDNFIKTKEFANLSSKQISKCFPGFNLLYEFKRIIESLCTKTKIRSFLNYIGNFIIPNKNLNNIRGKEKYYPPYGWIGIGLNIIYESKNKYYYDNWLDSNNDCWAIAYIGIGGKLPSNKIKNILNDIITKKNLKPDYNQIRAEYNDIRHPGNKIGNGIYLYSDINIAEKYSGIIPIIFESDGKFYIKKYKVALMAKVFVDNIREPEDIKFWILNNEDIRIYRILLKEII